MAATNAQVTDWSNNRSRVRAEDIRRLYIRCKSDQQSFTSIGENLNNSPTWTDTRVDVPNQLTPADLLGINAFIDKFCKLVEGTFVDLTDANNGASFYQNVANAWVRSPEG